MSHHRAFLAHQELAKIRAQKRAQNVITASIRQKPVSADLAVSPPLEWLELPENVRKQQVVLERSATTAFTLQKNAKRDLSAKRPLESTARQESALASN